MKSNTIKIAIQKKGYLNDETILFLKKKGLEFDIGNRDLVVNIKNANITLYLVRNCDIPRLVESGICDLGIVGSDQVLEQGSNVTIIKELGFSRCRLSIAIPKYLQIKSIEDLQGKKIATSYPNIVKNYFTSENISIDVETLQGSVEIAPILGLSDIIVDVVSSGNTLRQNNLIEFEKICYFQAIAGVSIGTKSLPKVDKIFGPGNSFVTQAKSYAQNNLQVSIDMPAGPSEVLVLTDEKSNPKFVASDLLSQAEHGSDSQSVLICQSIEFSKKVLKEIDSQIQKLSRKELILESLENSFIVICPNIIKSIEFINSYAPEHVIIQTEESDSISNKIINAGSIFIGPYSPESVGDYASGTNHVLPTSGFAKSYSGITVQSFMKTISYQKLSFDGLKLIAPTVSKLADIEGLDAHKNAVEIRI